MKKIINIKSESALEEITDYQNKQYLMCDVRFTNTYLKEINNIVGSNLFYKNDLFANSTTLWELMQPQEKQDDQESHNYHGLTPLDILDALNNIISPYCIFKTKQNRISIILSCLSHFGEPLMAVVEIGVGLIEDEKANINKLVTMYPKSNIEKIINKLEPSELLYLNKLP